MAVSIASAKPRVRSHQPSNDIGIQLGVSGLGHVFVFYDEKVSITRSDHYSRKSASYVDTWLRENDQTQLFISGQPKYIDGHLKND